MTKKKKQNISRKHHFVPKLYLREFANNKKVIEVYDLVRLKPFSTGIGDIGYKNKFHTVDGNVSREFSLSKRESKKWSPVLKRIITSKSLDGLTTEERSNFAEFVGYQYVRTTKYRDWRNIQSKLKFRDINSEQPTEKTGNELKTTMAVLSKVLKEINFDENDIKKAAKQYNMSEKQFRQEIDKLINKKSNKMSEVINTGRLPDEWKFEVDNKELELKTKNWHVEQMDEIADEIVEIIKKCFWGLIENQTDFPFITSDNPVFVTEWKSVLHLEENETNKIFGLIEWMDQNGIPNPDLFVMLPLSPKLMLFCRNNVKADTRLYKELDEEVIKYLIEIYILQANRQLYGVWNGFEEEFDKSIELFRSFAKKKSMMEKSI